MIAWRLEPAAIIRLRAGAICGTPDVLDVLERSAGEACLLDDASPFAASLSLLNRLRVALWHDALCIHADEACGHADRRLTFSRMTFG